MNSTTECNTVKYLLYNCYAFALWNSTLISLLQQCYYVKRSKYVTQYYSHTPYDVIWCLVTGSLSVTTRSRHRQICNRVSTIHS